MPSELKSDTARANGAKSHGPHTPEGRARSSANSRTHGLAAKYLLLPNDSDQHFELLLADYLDQFQPQSGVETELVEVMAIARWRLRRLLTIESHLFDTEIVRSKKPIDREFNNLDQDARLAWVFQKMADKGHSIALMIRYEGSLNRSYDRAFTQLLVLQSRRDSPPAASVPPAPIQELQNEPKPDPQPEPAPAGTLPAETRLFGPSPEPTNAAAREGAITNPRAAGFASVPDTSAFQGSVQRRFPFRPGTNAARVVSV